jgi:hypothetical protein
MKLKIEIIKTGRHLHEGIYEVDDNATFGPAWADAWVEIRKQFAAKAIALAYLCISCTKACRAISIWGKRVEKRVCQPANLVSSSASSRSNICRRASSVSVAIFLRRATNL